MEPELMTGSIIVTRPVDPESLKTGDIITFCDCSSDPKVCTHRVIKIWSHSTVYFKTMGDACKQPDPFIVSAKNVLGKVSFNLRYAGYIIQFVKSPAGLITCTVISAMLLFILGLKDLRRILGKSGKRIFNPISYR